MTRAKGGPPGDRRGNTAETVGSEVHAEALRRYRAGEITREIAADLGISADTIWRWASRAGVRRGRGGPGIPRPQQATASRHHDEAVERYRAGESARAVALDLGISESLVYDWARARGIHKGRGGGPNNSVRQAEAVRLWRSGATSVAEIAERLGVTPPAVSQWLDRAGVREIQHRPPPDELIELRGVAVDDLEAARGGLVERGYTETAAREPGVGEYRIDREHEVILWRERPRWYSTGEAAVALSEALPELPTVTGNDVRGAVRCGLLAGSIETPGGAQRVPRRAVESLIAARRRHAARLAELGEDLEQEAS